VAPSGDPALPCLSGARAIWPQYLPLLWSHTEAQLAEVVPAAGNACRFGCGELCAGQLRAVGQSARLAGTRAPTFGGFPGYAYANSRADLHTHADTDCDTYPYLHADDRAANHNAYHAAADRHSPASADQCASYANAALYYTSLALARRSDGIPGGWFPDRAELGVGRGAGG